MKRILTFFAAICAFCVAMAQNPMATLSHNGELSFFHDIYAFQKAVEAAQDGDIIYLSYGEFFLDGGSFTITKRLSIVGTGHDSHIVGNVSFAQATQYTMEEPLFDGVRFDNLGFWYNDRNYTGEVEIRRCRIGKLEYGDQAGTNVIFDKCYVENAGRSSGVTYLNSKIVYSSSDCGPIKLASNCNLGSMYFFPKNVINCIWSSPSGTVNGDVNNPSTVVSTLMNFTPETGVFINDCYIQNNATLLDENLEATVDLVKGGYLGRDGHEVGIYGGEEPYSTNSSLPSGDLDKTSVQYDPASSRLKVTINIKAD